MTDLANHIRSIRLNKHVDFMVLGDPVKLLFLGVWARSTELPGVYQTIYTCAGDQVRCNIWDLAENADSTTRMFHMDGTPDTGFDYCIIFYDTITRTSPEPLDKWTTVKDGVCARQHPERECKLVVIIIKTPRTDRSVFQHVVDSCQRQDIHCIFVDNDAESTKRIGSLPEKLTGLTYLARKERHSKKIQAVLA
jgi:hypothetical protein